MDPVTVGGLVLSVAGLVPLCASCFQFIENIISAPKAAAKAVELIAFQSMTFITWAERWKIDIDDQQPSNKAVVVRQESLLKEHLQGGIKTGPYIIRALVSIVNTFRSVQELEKKYGIDIKASKKNLPNLPPLDADEIIRDSTSDAKKIINSEPLDPGLDYIKKRRMQMSIFKQVGYVLRGGHKIESLAKELEQYIDNLMKTCPPEVTRNIEMMMFVRILFKRQEPRELESLSQVAKQKSSRKEDNSQDHAVYDLIKDTAIFKSRLKVLDPDKSDIVHDKINYRYNVHNWNFNNGEGTLAVSRQSRSVRYIEWKSYSTKNGKDSLETEGDIKMLALLLASHAKPAEICTRRCLGVFKDPSNTRYGIIYEPPRYIVNFWTTDTQDSAVANLCKPVSLLKLLERSADPAKSESILDLGLRFRLAKKLVQSVLILHVTGLLHKNIRSTSVMFLPAESQIGGPSRFLRLDYERPWLCGFGRSRLEESTSQYELRKRTRAAEVEADIYLHPEKRIDSSRKTIQAYDIYSLGCVLLEIGLWQSLDSFDHARLLSEEQFRDYLRDQLTRDLVGQAGAKYASAVKECLSMTSKHSDRESQDILCRKVVTVLDGCSA